MKTYAGLCAAVLVGLSLAACADSPTAVQEEIGPPRQSGGGFLGTGHLTAVPDTTVVIDGFSDGFNISTTTMASCEDGGGFLGTGHVTDTEGCV